MRAISVVGRGTEEPAREAGHDQDENEFHRVQAARPAAAGRNAKAQRARRGAEANQFSASLRVLRVSALSFFVPSWLRVRIADFLLFSKAILVAAPPPCEISG